MIYGVFWVRKKTHKTPSIKSDQQGLIENSRNVLYWPKRMLFSKKDINNFTILYSIPFVSVLHQNKALHYFHKRGKRPVAGHIKDLDEGLTKTFEWNFFLWAYKREPWYYCHGCCLLSGLLMFHWKREERRTGRPNIQYSTISPKPLRNIGKLVGPLL